MKRTTIIEIICFLYAILFLYTGISKLMEYDTFKEQLLESPLLPFGAPVVAILVPLLEFLVVLCLVVPRLRLKGLYAALATMVAFTGYILGLMSFSDKLPCSCGGIISALSWQQHVVFNCAFLALAVWGVILQRRLVKDNKKLWTSNISLHQSIAPKNI
jgi:uncharacterized membrane protein YphA (DoxX/SURF4 family)